MQTVGGGFLLNASCASSLARILRKGAQSLGCRGCCPAFIHACRLLEHARHGQQNGDELTLLTIGTGEFGGVAPHHLRRFEQTSLLVSSTTGDDHPLLEHQRQQFGVDLTQDTGRIRGGPLVEMTMTLPQFEQQFDLPTQPHHDHRFI